MKKTVILAGAMLLAAIGTAGAQDISGRVINAPYFDAGRRLLLSQNDYTQGTARSAAMGGAFTSLGADLSSMSINPAGLGMYQSSDIGITQSLSIASMKTSAANINPNALSSGGNRLAYGLNNVGIAYNVLNRSGALTSLTLGFSYNRLANFNSHSYTGTRGEDSSIADMFRNQLNLMSREGGITPGDLENRSDPFYNEDIYLEEWGAVLGYQTGLMGITGDGEWGYLNGVIPSDSYFSSTTRGGIHEYDFSIGANIANFLYLGATVTATEINYREDNTYEEIYPESSEARGMVYDQYTRMEGEGLTAKFGVVARPVPALRIGVAFHLPTYYTIDKSYTSKMSVGSYSADTDEPLSDRNEFRSAPRLLVGVSGVIADRAILAVDYDVAWYNSIRARGVNQSAIEESKQEARSLYKPGQSIRAGFEFRASDVLALRAGGGYSFDFMKDSGFVTNNPTVKSYFTVSGGAGFNIGRNAYLDLTYLYNRAKYTKFDYYFYDDGDNIASQYDMVDGNDVPRDYTPRRNNHQIMLTLGTRF